jgi:hypothetical protein
LKKIRRKKKIFLEDLYAKIPGFKCKETCIDCCGEVPCCDSEWVNILKYIETKGIVPFPPGEGKICPFAHPVDGCMVYPVRPLICRLFGSCEESGMKCPHGFKPDQPLTEIETMQLVNIYIMYHVKEVNRRDECLTTRWSRKINE